MEAPVTRPADPYPTSYPKSPFWALGLADFALRRHEGVATFATDPKAATRDYLLTSSPQQMVLDGLEVVLTSVLPSGSGAAAGVAGRELIEQTAKEAAERAAVRSRSLFRGDGRGIAEIFSDGFTARNPAMTLQDHLAGGNGLIAASRRRFVADGFAIQNGGLTYVIDDIGNGIAIDYGELGFRHLYGEAEVVFTRIDPAQIRGAFELDGTWVPNPGYVKPA